MSYILQCDPNGLPTAIEDDFHDFDEVCSSCAIERGFVQGAPDCPSPNCDDQSGNEAYAFLTENGCSTGCADKTECREKYITLRVVHDGCDHDVLTTDAEEGLHDFEESCSTVVCNAKGSEKDQLTCASGAATATATLKTLASGIAVLGTAVLMVV